MFCLIVFSSTHRNKVGPKKSQAMKIDIACLPAIVRCSKMKKSESFFKEFFSSSLMLNDIASTVMMRTKSLDIIEISSQLLTDSANKLISLLNNIATPDISE